MLHSTASSNFTFGNCSVLKSPNHKQVSGVQQAASAV